MAATDENKTEKSRFSVSCLCRFHDVSIFGFRGTDQDSWSMSSKKPSRSTMATWIQPLMGDM